MYTVYYTGTLITSDIGKANLLNEYFQSVFTLDDNNLPHFPSRIPPTSSGINDVTINPTIVKGILKKLKTNSAAGPDSLPPLFFHKTSESISFPLSTLFRIFLDLHTLPTEWKLSIVTPIFKKGVPSNPINYRPISLTCSCCKIMESIIANELITFLNDHHLINKNQHGFLKRHSTVTNLLESTNDWTLSLSKHNSVVIAYIDFQRAFDSVPHPKLIHKLSSYGIHGNLLFWISSFLSNRLQRVRVGSALSGTCSVISGVPQGSVIGCLLFNLYINDITDSLDSTTTSKIFADDLKIYTELSSTDSIFNLQNHLNLIHRWSVTWQLQISQSKCHTLTLGPTTTGQTLFISHTPISITSSIVDLGITIDPDLNFKKHIHDIVVRAKQRAALIHRCFISHKPVHLIRAYITYVRPLLEYATQVWSPYHVSLINLLETVQRGFTKRIPGFWNLSYAERLNRLQLQSLEHRRLLSDLVLCFNIVHGLIALPFDDFFKMHNYSSTRGHSFKLIIPPSKTNRSKFFFSSRVIPVWNSLPQELVSVTTSSHFKKLISSHDLTVFIYQPSHFRTEP